MMEWLTKEQDMDIAHDILAHHYEEPEDEVGVQEVTITPEGSMLVERAQWVIELEETLEARYGEEAGYDVAQRVVAQLLMQGEQIH